MKRKNIITGIDIGTTKIIAIIAEMITDDELVIDSDGGTHREGWDTNSILLYFF